MIVGAVLAAGCGAKPPPPAEVPSATAPQAADDNPNRKLTKSDCESLSATIVEACNNRGNDRSSEADGWCSEMLRTNEGGSGTWITSDCVPHFRYMDAFCFRGARNAHAMMDCDRTVDRTR